MSQDFQAHLNEYKRAVSRWSASEPGTAECAQAYFAVVGVETALVQYVAVLLDRPKLSGWSLGFWTGMIAGFLAGVILGHLLWT